jgi:hypothetical protein
MLGSNLCIGWIISNFWELYSWLHFLFLFWWIAHAYYITDYLSEITIYNLFLCILVHLIIFWEWSSAEMNVCLETSEISSGILSAITGEHLAVPIKMFHSS